MGLIGYSLILLIVSILVALLARRLRLPYSVGLVIAGIVLALTHVQIGIDLTPEFILDVLLPPLLFEAALNLRWKELQRDLWPILTLAVCGVLISALFTAWGMALVLGWPLPSALVFGALIAATDPVAVIALFKDLGLGGRVRLLVESESLFNDGSAAVLFALLLAFAQTPGAPLMPATMLGSLALMIGGGIAAGGICSVLAVAVARRTNDRLVETALTAVTAYGSFLFAQSVGASGVLATVTAGLIVGTVGASKAGRAANLLTERGYAFILDFWEFVAFLADSVIFLLIGLRVAAVPFASFGWLALIIVIALTLGARALSVYPLSWLFSRSSHRIPRTDQHVLWWGGLRGALAIALSLSLPATFPMRNEIEIAAFGVVAFSVLVQGLTMPLLLKKLSPSA